MVESIKNLYFEWMTKIAISDERLRNEYSNLLEALNNITFYFTIPLDENRAVDGADLRYRFGNELNINTEDIQHHIDNRECSMLEMMVALAVRGEEHIMEDSDIGNQTTCWFMDMLTSLKLTDTTNNNFDIRWVEYCIDRLLNHDYESNGEGGLFTVQNPRQDMRHVDIWYQMMWYLNAVLN